MILMDEYTGSTIWVTDLVEYIGRKLPMSVPQSALLTLGVLPYIPTVVFILLIDGAPSSFILNQVLVAFIPTAGVVFIWYYDEKVFPAFILEVSGIVSDEQRLLATIERYERFFCERYWMITLPWIALIVSALITNISYFQMLGVAGYLDPAFIVYLTFAVWWSMLTGIGLHGALTTVLCVHAVGDLGLQIDPLHHDGLGGLSTVGFFSIRATLMNSIGSFAFPIVFSIASEGGSETIVYFAAACYIAFLLASFFYPTFYINRRAQEAREDILKEKRTQIRALQSSISDNTENSELGDLETQLRIQTLREDFNDYKKVNLYPLSISVLTRLATSVLLPFVFLWLETNVFTS
jgi:hypothetical protein